MSEFGDKFFRRLQRINAGLEPATQAGRRCARCKKDLSDYLLLFEPKPTDVCNECDVEIRKEGCLARWKAAKPPIYDIDSILFAPEKKPWDILSDLNSKIDPFCPESLLLEPELVVRDFEEFSGVVGEPFGYVIALGVRQFSHALRAMRVIGARHMVECMTKFQAYAASRGVTFPDPMPDPWLDHVGISYDLENELNSVSRELKPYEGSVAGDFDWMVVEYLRQHVDVLRQRKPLKSQG
jgi:hypothetical protein